MNVIELRPDQGIMIRDGEDVVVLSQAEILALLARADHDPAPSAVPQGPTLRALRTATALQQLRKASGQVAEDTLTAEGAGTLKAAQDEMILAFENSGGPKESPYLADQAYAVASSHKLSKLLRYLESSPL